MRRTSVILAGLFFLSAALVLTGCDASKPTGEGKPLPPSQEYIPKGTKGKGKLAKDSLDDLPPPTRAK